MDKKGEYEGRAIGALLFIIAFFVALYVLLLPPADRDILLGENSTTSPTLSSSSYKELFTATPGLITPEKEFGTAHDIGSINLFLKTEPKILKLANSLTISNSLFSSSSPKLSFEMESSTDLDKVTLFFSIVNEPTGILSLKINGKEFFSETSPRGVKIIEVPITYLEKNNKIEVSVSNPGVLFWKKNKYELKEMGIKQEFERINTNENRMFTISKSEKQVLDEATLTFYQFCNSPIPSDSAGLRILMNDKEVFRGEIRCISTKHTVGIDSNLIVTGTNNLVFSLDEGDFSFNEISLNTKSEGDEFSTYIFQVSSTDLNELNNKRIILNLLLDSSNKNKNAVLRINGGDIFMRTTADSFEADITSLVEQGSNFITIQPGSTFTINGLKVFIK